MEGTILPGRRHRVRLAFFLLIAGVATLGAAPIRIRDFELADQHNRIRRYRFPKSNITVMAISDHKGSAQLEPWISQIYQRFGGSVNIDGIADLSPVPSSLQSAVRLIFRNRLAYSVMLDWNGNVVRQFQYKPGEANLYLLDRNGWIVHCLSGPVEKSKLIQLSQALETELKPD